MTSNPRLFSSILLLGTTNAALLKEGGREGIGQCVRVMKWLSLSFSLALSLLSLPPADTASPYRVAPGH